MKSVYLSVTALATAASMSLLLAPASAVAANVNATLSAAYYEVASHSDPDFNVGTMPNVAAGSMLGPNGLPVATASYGVQDVNAVTHEITWWSPQMNAHVISTGTGTVSLPYSSNMYAPNSTGSNDGQFFETAVFSGNLTLSSPSVVSFTLGSDDDSFIYVDGTLIGQNPGVHGVTTVQFSSPTLGAGQHSVAIFYADRQVVGANLSLSLISTGLTLVATDVPEPASMVLLGAGLLSLGVVRRRR